MMTVLHLMSLVSSKEILLLGTRSTVNWILTSYEFKTASINQQHRSLKIIVESRIIGLDPIKYYAHDV